MDYTPLTSQLLSLACHCILIGWVYWDYMAAPIETTNATEEQLDSTSIEDNTKPQAVLGKIIAAPPLDIAEHSQNVDAFAALPLQQLADFNDDATFTAAIKDNHKNTSIPSNVDIEAVETTIALPKTQVPLSSFTYNNANQEPQQAPDLKQRRSDLNQFAYTMSIIIGSHYYQRHWKKKIEKSISNFELKLLVRCKNSRIVTAEILRGSGVQVFDESLLRWIGKEKPGGPPLADGQYPIVIKLK